MRHAASFSRGCSVGIVAHAEEPDLFCGEVTSTLASQHPPLLGDDIPRREIDHELEYDVFLRALLRKMDDYRPRSESLEAMQREDFLRTRAAVVDWFYGVALSYSFSKETVVVALSNFDRYVAEALRAVDNSLLLQLVAYVALLTASKMEEVKPLQMSCLGQLTSLIFTPQQVRVMEMSMLHKLQFRMAPPSADEMLQCLVILLHPGWPSDTPLDEVLALGAQFLLRAQKNACWFVHSSFTLAVSAFACAFDALGLGWLKGSVLRGCDSRARDTRAPGAAVDFRAVAACSAVMMGALKKPKDTCVPAASQVSGDPTAASPQGSAVAATKVAPATEASGAPAEHQLHSHSAGRSHRVASSADASANEPAVG
ncbi:unnamed protein product, partial [Discosporangium mesarthrocarpum]